MKHTIIRDATKVIEKAKDSQRKLYRQISTLCSYAMSANCYAR